MPLNLSAGGEDFTPYIKFNAKAGRFYVRPKGAQQDVEVEKPRLAIDMAHIKTGWLFYQEGGSPEKLWDPSPSQAAPRPVGPRKFKRGFEVMVYGADNLPGVGKLELRELSSTAGTAISAILKMHAAYEQGLPKNPGKVPFFKCSGVLSIPGAYGTNYEPVFDLMAWIDRAKVPAFDDHMSERDAQEPSGSPFPPDQPGGNGAAHSAPTGGPPKGHPANLDDEIPF